MIIRRLNVAPSICLRANLSDMDLGGRAIYYICVLRESWPTFYTIIISPSAISVALIGDRIFVAGISGGLESVGDPRLISRLPLTLLTSDIRASQQRTAHKRPPARAHISVISAWRIDIH